MPPPSPSAAGPRVWLPLPAAAARQPLIRPSCSAAARLSVPAWRRCGAGPTRQPVTRTQVATAAAVGGSNGTPPAQLRQQQQLDHDPVAAMLWAAAQQDSMQVVFEGGNPEEAAADDELEGMLEDLEDPWMRHPSPPEWSESALFDVSSSSSSSNNGSSSSNGGSSSKDAAGSSSDVDLTPGLHFATVTWQQLGQLVQQQGQQQRKVVLLEVLCDSQEQQQQQNAPRPLPDPLPWLATSKTPQQQQQQQQAQQQQPAALTVVRCDTGVTRQQAAAWQQQGALVAVWDSGHHSCLAAAIRLSAVYRLADVVLLQQL